MAQLLVRNLEDQLVQKLRERAAKAGVSTEEAHRRILREALCESSGRARSLKDHLLAIPAGPVEEDSLFELTRITSTRAVDLE